MARRQGTNYSEEDVLIVFVVVVVCAAVAVVVVVVVVLLLLVEAVLKKTIVVNYHNRTTMCMVPIIAWIITAHTPNTETSTDRTTRRSDSSLILYEKSGTNCKSHRTRCKRRAI